MQLWQDGLVAMLFSRPEQKQDILVLLPAQGDGENLEQQVRQLSRLRYEQGVLGMVLVVDCGLSEEGRKLAKVLSREDRWVSVCKKEEIGSYLS